MWQKITTVVVGVGIMCLSALPIFKTIATYLLMVGFGLCTWVFPHIADWGKSTLPATNDAPKDPAAPNATV